MRAESGPGASAGPGAADDVAVRRRFARNLEGRRRERGLTVERLAARSEIGTDRLDEILEAKDEARYGEVAMLAGALGVDPEQLFDGIVWNPPKEGGRGFEIAGQDATAEPEAPSAEPGGSGS